MQRLSELKIGEEAIIHSFGTDDLSIKLMEMGCLPGEKVVVEQVAMLGDPISVYVAGYNLSLRLDEAKLVYVELVNK